MIDEKKLLRELTQRRLFQDDKGDEYDETGRNISRDICYNIQAELTRIENIIEKQPKVGEWIPVNERLPVAGVDVEVTTESGERKLGHHLGGVWYEAIYTTHISVIAWKEPSEPWKGEEK